MKLADMTPEQIACAEWKVIGVALEKAKQMLEADGCRHSWLDAPIEICNERSSPNAPARSA